jgi:hypothetical protein
MSFPTTWPATNVRWPHHPLSDRKRFATAREQRFRPAVKVERLEGRELTASLLGPGAAPAGVERPHAEVRAVTVGNVEAIHSYHMNTAFFIS